MEGFMARDRGGASHHTDVECAYAGLEWFLVLSAFNTLYFLTNEQVRTHPLHLPSLRDGI